MNTERCSLGLGLVAGAFVLLILAAPSMRIAPDGVAPVPDAGLGVPAASVRFSPSAPSARAVLPAQPAQPTLRLERLLLEGPPDVFAFGLRALVGTSPRAPEAALFSVADPPAPRPRVLHVYRC